MHINQVQTIGSWKGAQEWPGKPCSCHLVNSHAFYKEWTDISRKCVAIVNHKLVVYSVNNYTKNETHGWKTWRLAWCHGIASPCPGKNWRMFSLCRDARLSLIKPAPWEFHGFEGEITRIDGGSKFSLSFVHEFFFYDKHTTCKYSCSNLALFRAHLPYLGDYVHFLGINAHNSSSNNRFMKGSTRTA